MIVIVVVVVPVVFVVVVFCIVLRHCFILQSKFISIWQTLVLYVKVSHHQRIVPAMHHGLCLKSNSSVHSSVHRLEVILQFIGLSLHVQVSKHQRIVPATQHDLRLGSNSSVHLEHLWLRSSRSSDV